MDNATMDISVLVTQGCQAVATMLFLVRFVANPDVQLVEERDGDSVCLGPVEVLPLVISRNLQADLGQVLGKCNHAVEIEKLTCLVPSLMVYVLLAPLFVSTGCL